MDFVSLVDDLGTPIFGNLKMENGLLTWMNLLLKLLMFRIFLYVYPREDVEDLAGLGK
jgi:hypothetical protein